MENNDVQTEVVSDVQTEVITTETVTDENPVPSNDDIMHMDIDCRKAVWWKNQVKVGEVMEAVEELHSDDFSKAVNYVRGVRGVFKVDADDYTRYLNTTVTIRGVQVPLIPRIKRERRHNVYSFEKPAREEGVYVTIYDAYERPFRHIMDDDINEYFANLKDIEILIPTQPQRKKPHNILTNNRYVVLKSTRDNPTSIDIGSFIQIKGIKFNLMYDGMQRYCYMCRGKHGKECPTLMRWKHLKSLRDGKTGKRKIYSDSCLRSANQLALTTDVVCMPGGGLGQLCNVIALDDEKNEEVIIHGGQNEIAGSESIKNFVYTVEKSAQKIEEIANDRSVTVVLPSKPLNGPTEMGKAQFLEEKILAIKNIKTIKLKDIDFDETSHPSQDGTKEMLRQINEHCKNEVIIDEAKEETTTTKKYCQVFPVYKVGCRGCNYLDFTPSLCQTCMDSDVDFEAAVNYLCEMIDKFRDTHFPQLGNGEFNGFDDDIEMKESMKHARENESHGEQNDDGVNAKKPRNVVS